jgi:hypothetical protein
MGEWRYSFIILTSALNKGERSASRSGRIITEETAPGIHVTGRWFGLRAALDVVE